MPIQLLDHADNVRRAIAPGIALKRKSALGQFMTPAPVARFMASLFPLSILPACTFLDAGAGVGALTCAFLDRWAASDRLSFRKAEVDAYEIDPPLRAHLDRTLANYAGCLPVSYRILSEDFIMAAAMQTMAPRRYTDRKSVV